jgi:hypothetical protein
MSGSERTASLNRHGDMSKSKQEFRCTRNSLYQGEGNLGKDDKLAREGHYIVADSEDAALDRMSELFPDDRRGFTADFWKNVPSFVGSS